MKPDLSMHGFVHDLMEEYRELADLAATLTRAQWREKTAFYDWSPWDEIAHLCFGDQSALLAVTAADAFSRDAGVVGKRLAGGAGISDVARERYGQHDGAALLKHWQSLYEALGRALEPLDPAKRTPWFGRAMSARSFATARLMETWAHGQDIWDMLGRQRPASARLRHIAHLGVSTYAWSFANRGQAVPDPVPRVRLTGHDGSPWTWGDPDSAEFVSGSAEDFCLVVTQRRHLEDTALQYSAGSARQWLHQAQCFAGPPSTGPAAGARLLRTD